MALEQAPVTGLLLAISALSTALTPRHYALLQRALVTPTWKATLKRLPLGSIPFGSLGVSVANAVCSVMLLYQMRTLERRWGSPSFLAFFLTTALAGSVMVNILVTESTPPLSLEQLRILSSGGSIVPLLALATRYVSEVPTLHHWRLPVTSIVFTERLWIILPILRLVFFPDTEIRARTHKHRAIHVDIGIWSRLVLVLVGILLGLASTQSWTISWWLRFSSYRICRPFLNLLQPILSTLFGPTNVVEFGIPRKPPGEQTVTNGRYTVDNLAGMMESGNATFVGGTPRGSTMRRRNRHTGGITGNGIVSDEKVAQILELGLGVDVEDIRAALVASNGQVDAAVEALVSRE